MSKLARIAMGMTALLLSIAAVRLARTAKQRRTRLRKRCKPRHRLTQIREAQTIRCCSTGIPGTK